MKSFFLAAAVATIAAVNAADCDLTMLAPVVASASATQCTTDSTYTFLPPTAPAADIVPKLCASTACQKVLADVTALGLGDCTVTVATPPVQLDAFLKSFTTACAGASSATASTGSGSSAGSATVTTPAPAATTEAPATATTTAPAAGSSASSSTVSTPAPSTTASAASAVTLASSAVVLAAAAAFM